MLPAELVAKLNQCATTDSVGPRDHWFSWLAGFTTTVFVGLVLELPELRYELKLIAREWIPYFRYRIITPPDRRMETAKVVAFIGWLLIVIGVGGERYAEVRVKDFDASIQECSDAKVRAATLEAGDAAQSATTAREEADKAKTEADAVTRETAAISTRLAMASKKLDALEVRLAWRILSKECRADIADKIEPDGQKIDIFMPPNEPEPDAIAGQIESVLQGWQVKVFQPLAGVSIAGMLIEVDSSDITAAHRATALAHVLTGKTCGFLLYGPIPLWKHNTPPTLGAMGLKPEAPIRLTIGTK